MEKMPAVISQFIKKMTFNDDLEKRKAIYLEGEYIPLSEVTWAQMTNPKAIFPRKYHLHDLSEAIQRAVLGAPATIKTLQRYPMQ